MTSHPNDMSDDLIECYADCEKLMPLLHLPVQTGSNKILKLMNRKHNIKYYLSIIEKLKKINDEIKFSSDFIIGYPGEEENDFNDTIKLIKEVGFINSYSFIFSPRPGTPAAKHKLNDMSINAERLKKVQSILEDLQYKNNRKYLNQNCEVLVENKLEKQERYFGRTKLMTPVIFDLEKYPGEIVNLKVSLANQKNLFSLNKNSKVNAA